MRTAAVDPARRRSWPGAWLWALMLAGLAGCATLPDYDPPRVTVTSFRMLPGSSLSPRFEIGLHFVNPNPIALRPDGLAYSLFIEDREILTGAANDLPELEAYGEEDITLTAVTNMLSSISLITDLLNRPRDEYRYRLEARLGLGIMGTDLRVVEEGSVNLTR